MQKTRDVHLFLTGTWLYVTYQRTDIDPEILKRGEFFLIVLPGF